MISKMLIVTALLFSSANIFACSDHGDGRCKDKNFNTVVSE